MKNRLIGICAIDYFKQIVNNRCLMFLFFVIAGFFFQGCNRKEDINILESIEQIQFHPVRGLKASVDRSWIVGEGFGVFMLNSGSNNLFNAFEKNRRFTYNGTLGQETFNLSDAGSPLYYPNSGNVDFIAYSPYHSTVQQIYPVNVSVQTNPTAIDLLYSNNAKRIPKSSVPVDLTFEHQLSKIRFVLTLGQGFDQTDQSSFLISIKGMPNEVDFDLGNGTFGPAINKADINIGSAREAIIIPQEGSAGRSFVFNHKGIEYTYNLDHTEDFEKGKVYEYQVKIINKEVYVSRANILSWLDNEVPVSTSMDKYVYIPPGIFQMGAPDSYPYANSDEKPQHWVLLTKGFYMSKYEITVSEYAEFLNSKNYDGIPGSFLRNKYGQSLMYIGNGMNIYVPVKVNGKWEAKSDQVNKPVNFVTFQGALEYALWAGGTLPSEAQWEYACRAGTTTNWHFGDDNSLLDNYEVIISEGNTLRTDVGTKLPNPWGLYDMHGNMAEFVLDDYSVYQAAATKESAIVDPVQAINGSTEKVYRGGIGTDFKNYRSSYRSYKNIGVMSEVIGFRIIIPE